MHAMKEGKKARVFIQSAISFKRVLLSQKAVILGRTNNT